MNARPRTRSILMFDVDAESQAQTTRLLTEAGYRALVVSSEEPPRDVSTEPPHFLIRVLRFGTFNALHFALSCEALAPDAPILVIGRPDDVGLAREAAHLGVRWASTATEPAELLAIITNLVGRGEHDYSYL